MGKLVRVRVRVRFWVRVELGLGLAKVVGFTAFKPLKLLVSLEKKHKLSISLWQFCLHCSFDLIGKH